MPSPASSSAGDSSEHSPAHDTLASAVDLRGRRLENDDLARLQEVWPADMQALNLEGNCISLFSASRLPSSLRVLILARNRLSKIGSIKFPPLLEKLDLSCNFISSVGISSLDLPNLTDLNVECNRLSSSNAADILFQCAAFCTTLQVLLLGGNCFKENELHRKLCKSGLPIETAITQRRGLLAHLSYPTKDIEKVSTDVRYERGRTGCLVVKIIAESAFEKDCSIRSSNAVSGDCSHLLTPERSSTQLESLYRKLTVSGNASNPAEFSPTKSLVYLQSLNLSSCNMNPACHITLEGILGRLPDLLELNLSLNFFPADSILVILRNVSTSLKTLIVCNAGLRGSDLAMDRGQMNVMFPSVNYIDLSDNSELEGCGFVVFLQLLAVENLIRLRASNCGIDFCNRDGFSHLQDISPIFHKARSLQNLDLSKNQLGSDAIEELLSALSPDSQNFGVRHSSRIGFTLSKKKSPERWMSPLRYINLSCTACDTVCSTVQFGKWLNSVFPYFSNLLHLNLSDNDFIYNLSANVSCLSCLEFLDLSNCKNLISIPDELISGTGSRGFDLSLHGCDSLEYPPKKKADEGIEALRRFIVDSEKVPLSHVKIVLLGNSGSGKRSFLCALANSPDSEHKSFDEMNQLIRRQYLSRKSWFAKKFGHESSPKLSFWNFGGELEYSSHLPFYMSSRQTVYVILYNVVESHEVLVQQISYWLRAIFDLSCSQNSMRIFFIGSHIDAIPSHLLEKHKEGVLDLIQKLLVAMNVFAKVDKQIFLDFWFSCDRQFPGYKDSVERITDTIVASSSKMFEEIDVPLFPKVYLGMIKEIKKLADYCEETKKFPLIKLAELSKDDGYEVLYGSNRNLRKLEAIKLLSDVGILISYKDLQEETWICVNLNFCVDVVMFFTNSMIKLKGDSSVLHESVMSKEDLYRKFKQFFETAVTSVSWYTSSLSQGYPESLFGFFIAQGLLIPVPATQFSPRPECGQSTASVDPESSNAVVSDDTLFMIPILLKGRPNSWKEVFGQLPFPATSSLSLGFGQAIRIKGLRYSSRSIEFMITVPCFLKIMLLRCNDARFMWGASFLYHVDGTAIFVRLAEDRHGIDIVILGSDALISEVIDREIQKIVIELGLSERHMQRLCPLCCTSDDFVKSGTARVYFQPQVDHYREFGLYAVCHHNHKLEASCVQEGSILQMPAAPDTECPFFPNVCLANQSLRKTVLWLDDKPLSKENELIRKGIPGYLGISDSPGGCVSLDFDFRNVDPANQLQVHCFKTVEAIKDFMVHPENLKFANYPPSMFRIISNRRLFIGDAGLCKFLDDPTTPWAFTYPSTMIFYGGNPEGLENLEDRPNAVKSVFSHDCIAFISFGFMLPSFSK